MAKNSPASWWFAAYWSIIPELSWTLSIVNWANDWNLYRKWTKIHETKHMDNHILMPDHRNGDALSRAKDEIIAYSTDGSSIERIKNFLFYKWDGALYDYYEAIRKNDPERYEKLRILYEKELDIAINIAEKLKEANIPNYIDILAITPVRQWGNLEKIYLNPNLSEIQKMEKNIQQIFEKVYETYRVVKNDSSNLIWEFSSDVLFKSVPLSVIWIIWSSYLVENYPNWKNDLDDNIKIFREKMKFLLSENKIKAYLDKYF